jgi:YggT family protein
MTIGSGLLTTAAIGREEIADYVEALLLVYFVLIFVNILLSWVEQFRPLPYNLPLRAVVGFVRESTDPYLNLFRRFIPPIGMFDLSPIVAILVLWLGGGLIVGLIRG